MFEYLCGVLAEDLTALLAFFLARGLLLGMCVIVCVCVRVCVHVCACEHACAYAGRTMGRLGISWKEGIIFIYFFIKGACDFPLVAHEKETML